MHKDQHILFIDSGIGGISILNYFLSIKNNVNIIYYADTGNFPYGNKDEKLIGKILWNIYSNLSTNFVIPLIIIACNTASVSALNYLRKKIDIPVIGTVPAVKPAALSTKKNNIGIIATQTTVNLSYLSKLIKQYAPDKKVFIKSSNKLVEAVEEFYPSKKAKKIIEKELYYFKDKNIDVLILGCTHYSFLKKEINKYFENNVYIIDSSEGVSKRIIQLMHGNYYSFNHEKILFLSNGKNGIKEKYINFNNGYKIFDKIIIEDIFCLKG